MKYPRIMLAAPASGSGKTTVTCGILQALVNRKRTPASFKCGPDYIDPMFHSRVIGAKSRNLDPFFANPETVRYLFARNADGAGISVMEGVMGFFDGLGGLSAKASSYDLACVTDTPVILIVNARGMSLSVIPLIRGFLDYQKSLGKEVIRGVILNQTTKMTYLLLKKEIEAQTGLRALGYVPRLENCVIESRHLGLVTPGEIRDLQEQLQILAGTLEETLDMDGILALAEEAEEYSEEDRTPPKIYQKWIQNAQRQSQKAAASDPDPIRIAVAMDEAFCFYYQDNLDLLRDLGAELLLFSPIHDRQLPAGIQALLLGGGYPELYAAQLADNKSLRAEIRTALRGGMPYLAECGGFMYLHDSMEDMEGRAYPMCGVISGKAFHTPRLNRFGYITLSYPESPDEAKASEPLSPDEVKSSALLCPGETIAAHEFHYFDSTNNGADLHAAKPVGKRSWECMHMGADFLAGFPHLYYWSNPELIARWLSRIS